MGFERQYDIVEWKRGATIKMRWVRRKWWRRVEWNKNNTNRIWGAPMRIEECWYGGHRAQNEIEDCQSRQRCPNGDLISTNPSSWVPKSGGNECGMIYRSGGWGMRNIGEDCGASIPGEERWNTGGEVMSAKWDRGAIIQTKKHWSRFRSTYPSGGALNGGYRVRDEMERGQSGHFAVGSAYLSKGALKEEDLSMEWNWGELDWQGLRSAILAELYTEGVGIKQPTNV